MRAWIGCLASYNAGRLIGEWFDVSTDADENAATIARILKASPEPDAEEYYVADYDDAPSALTRLLGEYPSAEGLALAAAFLESAEGLDIDADTLVSVYIDTASPQRVADLDGVCLSDWSCDHYAGAGDTLTDWCAGYLEETGTLDAIPEALRNYFDTESYARDMRLGGDVFTVENPAGGVLVFWNH